MMKLLSNEREELNSWSIMSFGMDQEFPYCDVDASDCNPTLLIQSGALVLQFTIDDTDALCNYQQFLRENLPNSSDAAKNLLLYEGKIYHLTVPEYTAAKYASAKLTSDVEKKKIICLGQFREPKQCTGSFQSNQEYTAAKYASAKLTSDVEKKKIICLGQFRERKQCTGRFQSNLERFDTNVAAICNDPTNINSSMKYKLDTKYKDDTKYNDLDVKIKELDIKNEVNDTKNILNNKYEGFDIQYKDTHIKKKWINNYKGFDTKYQDSDTKNKLNIKCKGIDIKHKDINSKYKETSVRLPYDPFLEKCNECFQYFLNDDTGVDLFRQFLKEEKHLTEIMNFYFACRGLKQIHKHSKKFRKVVHLIFEKQVKVIGCISPSTKHEIQQKLTSNADLDIHIFDKAESEVETYMLKAIFPKFLNSYLFRLYLEKKKNKQ